MLLGNFVLSKEDKEKLKNAVNKYSPEQKLEQLLGDLFFEDIHHDELSLLSFVASEELTNYTKYKSDTMAYLFEPYMKEKKIDKKEQDKIENHFSKIIFGRKPNSIVERVCVCSYVSGSGIFLNHCWAEIINDLLKDTRLKFVAVPATTNEVLKLPEEHPLAKYLIFKRGNQESIFNEFKKTLWLNEHFRFHFWRKAAIRFPFVLSYINWYEELPDKDKVEVLSTYIKPCYLVEWRYLSETAAKDIMRTQNPISFYSDFFENYFKFQRESWEIAGDHVDYYSPILPQATPLSRKIKSNLEKLVVNPEKLNKLKKSVEEIENINPDSKSPILVHSDLHLENILLTKYYTIIDWEKAEFGNPFYDIIASVEHFFNTNGDRFLFNRRKEIYELYAKNIVDFLFKRSKKERITRLIDEAINEIMTYSILFNIHNMLLRNPKIIHSENTKTDSIASDFYRRNLLDGCNELISVYSQKRNKKLLKSFSNILDFFSSTNLV